VLRFLLEAAVIVRIWSAGHRGGLQNVTRREWLRQRHRIIREPLWEYLLEGGVQAVSQQCNRQMLKGWFDDEFL
jgi:hypothetical protein